MGIIKKQVPKPQSVETTAKTAGDLALRYQGLAEGFEQEGKHGLAAQYRDRAQQQAALADGLKPVVGQKPAI